MKTCSYDSGTDAEPTCPACGHYNAMLSDHDATNDGKDNRKCRDCGTKAVRIETTEGTQQ